MPAKKKEVPVVKKTLADYQPHSYRMDVYSIKREKTDGWIELEGMFSEAFDKASKTVRAQLTKEDLNVDDEAVKALASLVLSWNEEWFGEPCTYDNVLAVLTNPKLRWITAQLTVALNDQTNFF